jgi:hypothetical protein
MRTNGFALVLIMSLSGCAVRPPTVTPLGDDRYSIGATSTVPSTAADRDAMNEATAYCANAHKTVNPQSISAQTRGEVYHANVVFTCS